MPRGFAAAAIYTNGTTADRTPASISSPATTVSRLPTWSRYDHKHNEANGEENRDGSDNNSAGTAGPKGRPTIRESSPCGKRRSAASGHAAAFAGVPMLLAGDEFGHSQNGNNNAYCQDNELTWLNWDFNEDPAGSVGSSCRRSSALLARTADPAAAATTTRATRGTSVKDIQWFNPRRCGDERRRLEDRIRPQPRLDVAGRKDRRRRPGRNRLRAIRY